MVVRLMDGAKVLAEQSVPATGAEWKEFPLVLTPIAASGNATLRILARARSNVKVDRVSLMADSSRANGGFRPDATQAIAALRPPVLRWPGVRFIWGYRWKDGIGPQVKRTDTLAFGIDEFLALAQKVNTEPVIVVWAGPRTQVDREPYLRDVLDLIEYCNGSAESTWGKVRAQHGHPAPYRREVLGTRLRRHAADGRVGRFVSAVRASNETGGSRDTHDRAPRLGRCQCSAIRRLLERGDP